VVSYKWTDRSGAQHELKMPHFCLTNIDKIHAHFRQYIVRAKWSYLESLVQRGDDELAWMTVSTAMAYARQKPGSLVADALDLWAISRMIEIPWQMCGEDTLGVERVKDKGSPHFGKIPIPPIMDTQLDQVVIQRILKPLRQSVVDKFEHMITPAKPEAWWEVYLASFVLLNHIERLARHSVDHARTHTMRVSISGDNMNSFCRVVIEFWRVNKGFGLANAVFPYRQSTPTPSSSKPSSTRPNPSSPASTLSATAPRRCGSTGPRPRRPPWPNWTASRSSL
jgi:hypothetical protein